MIQHAPAIDSKNFSTEEQAELADEVFTVRHRAPEIPIALPPARPNTALANGVLTEILKIEPSKADNFRCLVYKALWVDGLDISSPEVLHGLCLESG